MGRKEFTQGTQQLAPSKSTPRSTLLANAEDISGGVSTDINAEGFSILISGTGGDKIKVEVSPDAGNTWFEVDESEFAIESDGDKTIQLEYTTTAVRVTNVTGTANTTVTVVEQ